MLPTTTANTCTTKVAFVLLHSSWKETKLALTYAACTKRTEYLRCFRRWLHWLQSTQLSLEHVSVYRVYTLTSVIYFYLYVGGVDTKQRFRFQYNTYSILCVAKNCTSYGYNRARIHSHYTTTTAKYGSHAHFTYIAAAYKYILHIGINEDTKKLQPSSR